MKFDPVTFTLHDGRECALRSAEPEDAAALVGYVNQVFGESPYLSRGAGEWTQTVEKELAWIESKLADPRSVLLLALDKLGEAADVLRELAQCAQLQEGQLALILRILGVALVSELAAQACRDAGEEGLALHVETGAKVILLLLSAPLLRQLAGLVMELTA